MNINTIRNKYLLDIHKAKIKAAFDVVSQVWPLFRKAQEAQPEITGIKTSYGAWEFEGKAIGWHTKDKNKEKFTVPHTQNIASYFRGEYSFYTMPKNQALLSVVEMMDFLCDKDAGIGAGRFFDGVNAKGIVFLWSDQGTPENPFYTTYSPYLEKLEFYRLLVKKGIPIDFVSNKHSNIGTPFALAI